MPNRPKDCVIRIPKGAGAPDIKDAKEIDVDTGDVPTIEIIEVLSTLTQQLAKMMVDEAKRNVGNDPDKQARWIDLQRQQAGLN